MAGVLYDDDVFYDARWHLPVSSYSGAMPDDDVAAEQVPSRSRRWLQAGAAGGVAFVVLQLVGQFLIAGASNVSEPAFDAPTADIVAFFDAQNAGMVKLGSYLSTLSVIPFLCFLGVLWSALRDSEGDPPWLSVSAVGSGLLVAAGIVFGGNWGELPVHRRDEHPETLRLLFDQGNLAFANLWVMCASLAFAASMLFLLRRAFPRWLGWLGIVSAIGLLAARAVWSVSELWFLPFALFYVWLVAVSLTLVRRCPVT
jgi:hypothetical protein